MLWTLVCFLECFEGKEESEAVTSQSCLGKRIQEADLKAIEETPPIAASQLPQSQQALFALLLSCGCAAMHWHGR